MTDDIILIPKTELQLMLRGIVNDELKRFEPLLNLPDTTILSDNEAAKRLGKSTSTLRRWKKDGRIGSISTPHGLMVRVCDLEKI